MRKYCPINEPFDTKVIFPSFLHMLFRLIPYLLSFRFSSLFFWMPMFDYGLFMDYACAIFFLSFLLDSLGCLCLIEDLSWILNTYINLGMCIW